MLKLTLKPGEYIDIGPQVRIVFSGGSANNIHLLVDAPREMQILRSSAGRGRGKDTGYYKEQGISQEAQKEIAGIIMREKRRAAGAKDAPETQTYFAPQKTSAAEQKGERHIYTTRGKRAQA